MSIIDGICLAFIKGNCYNSSDLLSPKTNIGQLVKKNFLNDREVIYEKSIS